MAEIMKKPANTKKPMIAILSGVNLTLGTRPFLRHARERDCNSIRFHRNLAANHAIPAQAGTHFSAGMPLPPRAKVPEKCSKSGACRTMGPGFRREGEGGAYRIATILGRRPIGLQPRKRPPLSRLPGNLKYPSFRGSGPRVRASRGPRTGSAREPGTQEHRPLPAWEWPVFIGSGPGPADHPGMTKK